MILTYSISDVEPYINWAYFYYAWQLKKPAEQEHIRRESESFLAQITAKYHTRAVFQLFDAHSEGDDIIIERDKGSFRLPMLRQQQAAPCLCLADFLHPVHDQIALFAVSTESGMECDFDADPYEKMMAQLLADRLAEATAERLHEEVRKHYWGYAKDEQLSMDDLHQERFQGIRPAVGYPSLPDASINFLIDELIDMKQIGIRLTESGAMRPHASVSGLMISHPQARYFSVGKIGEDQLADYARRRAIPIIMARKFLAANM